MTIAQRNRVKKKRKKVSNSIFHGAQKRVATVRRIPLVTSVKQSGIDDPGRRDTSENRGQRALKRKEEGGRGKGAAVGQVKWRVPAGFYAALATGPPCLSATTFSRSPSTFYFYHSRLPAFHVPVSSQPFFPRIKCLCTPEISRDALDENFFSSSYNSSILASIIITLLSFSFFPNNWSHLSTQQSTPNWTSSCKNYNSSTPGAWSRAINLPSRAELVQSKRNLFGCLSRLRPGGTQN